MSMIHEYFPQEYIELQKELMEGGYEDLQAILSACKAEDVDLKLSHIAAYCEIMLDGVYTLDERRKLCTILVQRLRAKRETANIDKLQIYQDIPRSIN